MKQKQYPETVIPETRIYMRHKAPETKCRPFRRAYLKLSSEDKIIVRDIIMKRGKISTIQQFNHLKLGKEPINLERYDLITSVFKAMNTDAWSGEPIYTDTHENKQ